MSDESSTRCSNLARVGVVVDAGTDSRGILIIGVAISCW